MIRYLKKLIKYWRLEKLYPESVVHFGASVDKNSLLGKNAVLFSDVIFQNSILGDYSYVQSDSVITSAKIGKFCSIASNVTIGLANHPTDLLSTSPVFYDNTQPLPFFFTSEKYFIDTIDITIIESDVWIGQGAMIKSGVKIGVGAVVGAGAIVTKNVEPYSIVAGVPAKCIKWRFDKELRDSLVDSMWWKIDENELIKFKHFFSEPKLFLEKLG